MKVHPSQETWRRRLLGVVSQFAGQETEAETRSRLLTTLGEAENATVDGWCLSLRVLCVLPCAMSLLRQAEDAVSSRKSPGGVEHSASMLREPADRASLNLSIEPPLKNMSLPSGAIGGVDFVAI